MKRWTEEANCYYCNEPLTKLNRTKDHVWPVSLGGIKGGQYSVYCTNLVACCDGCNRKKGNFTPRQFKHLIETAPRGKRLYSKEKKPVVLENLDKLIVLVEKNPKRFKREEWYDETMLL